MIRIFIACLWFAAAAQELPKQTYTYKTVGNLPIQADVYRPAGDQVRPAIIWIHGGALIAGSRRSLPPAQRDAYLKAGHVVVSIDYRLAPETKLPGILEDLRDAHRWVRQSGPRLFGIDPDRIAVVGHSAGGYLTLMAGAILKPRPAALVAFYGYGDIAGPWYSRPDPFYSKQPAIPREDAYASVGGPELAVPPPGHRRFRFYIYCRQQGLWPKEVAGRDPHAEPAAFNPWCPVRNVGKDYPPTLLLHGDADTDVPYGQSVQMAAELKRRGIPHELITIPGGPHGFDGAIPQFTESETFKRVLRFLARFVGQDGILRGGWEPPRGRLPIGRRLPTGPTHASYRL